LAIRLRLEGKTYQKVSEATGVPIKTLQNSFAKGGRLCKAFNACFTQSRDDAEEVTENVLMKARKEAGAAIERLITLSQSAENEAVFYKANEFLLHLAGVSAGSAMRDTLKKMTYEKAKEMMTDLFKEIFGKPPYEERDIFIVMANASPSDAAKKEGRTITIERDGKAPNP